MLIPIFFVLNIFFCFGLKYTERKVVILDNKQYDKKVKDASPNSPLLKNCVCAFVIGGLICLIGEGLFTLFSYLGQGEKESAAWVCVSLISLTAALTGIGVFDVIAKHAGAGTVVPITGFANSVVSPAIEYQTEGRIMGTAVKMFTIAGPVIVYGCSAASIYGLIYYFFLGGNV
ncbi:MAG: stage V sporulation protein AC [Oscillospiraceae bacterium]|nr:stage V sporulation protein AC [Oscillospiraceae bacterium]